MVGEGVAHLYTNLLSILELGSFSSYLPMNWSDSKNLSVDNKILILISNS